MDKNVIDSQRLERLVAFDRQYTRRAAGNKHDSLSDSQLTLFDDCTNGVIGVDEVGRGCLAGPVMAGAVMLPAFAPNSQLAKLLSKLNDSKQVGSKRREALARSIRACAWCAVGVASPDEIDEINILRASHLAMKRAVVELRKILPDDLRDAIVLVDGKSLIIDLPGEQVGVPKGDTQSAAIAAASIVAKVQRDSFMIELSDKFACYGWQSNKGYPSEGHCQAIKENGLSLWHRNSFKSQRAV